MKKSLIPACLNLRMTKILSEAYLLYKIESVTCHKDSICNSNVALVSLHGGKKEYKQLAHYGGTNQNFNSHKKTQLY